MFTFFKTQSSIKTASSALIHSESQTSLSSIDSVQAEAYFLSRIYGNIDNEFLTNNQVYLYYKCYYNILNRINHFLFLLCSILFLQDSTQSPLLYPQTGTNQFSISYLQEDFFYNIQRTHFSMNFIIFGPSFI